MQTMNVSIISPEEEIYKGLAEMVVVPGEDGDFAAMFEHAPLITYLRPGKLEVIEEENRNMDGEGNKNENDNQEDTMPQIDELVYV